MHHSAPRPTVDPPAVFGAKEGSPPDGDLPPLPEAKKHFYLNQLGSNGREFGVTRVMMAVREGGSEDGVRRPAEVVAVRTGRGLCT